MNENELFPEFVSEVEKKNKLQILQEELIKQQQIYDDDGPVILGSRGKPPGFYQTKPKFPGGEE